MRNPNIAPAGIHIVDGIPSGSIRTVEGLRGVLREVVQPMLGIYPAVALPKGVIDRSVFPIDELHAIPNQLPQAQLHKHATVHLVPDGTGRTGTLLASVKASVRALHDVFGDPRVLALYRRGVLQLPETCTQGWTVEKMRLACKVALCEDIALDAPELPGWLQCFSDRENVAQFAFSAYSPLIYGAGIDRIPDPEALRDAFQEHQLALGNDAVLLDWTMFDVGSIRKDYIHARDVRTSARRGNDEKLYDAMRIPQ